MFEFYGGHGIEQEQQYVSATEIIFKLVNGLGIRLIAIIRYPRDSSMLPSGAALFLSMQLCVQLYMVFFHCTALVKRYLIYP